MTLDKHREVKFCTNCFEAYPDYKLHKKDNIEGDIRFFLRMNNFQPINSDLFEQLKDFILFSQDDNGCKYPGFKY